MKKSSRLKNQCRGSVMSAEHTQQCKHHCYINSQRKKQSSMQTRQVKKEAVDASLQLHIVLYWSPLHIYYQNNPHRSWCSPSVRPLAVMLFLFCCILETEAVSHS